MRMIGFGCFTDYRLKFSNGHNSTSYIFYGLVLWGVLVFVITKTKRGLKFDLKLGRKNRTEDNLTD